MLHRYGSSKIVKASKTLSNLDMSPKRVKTASKKLSEFNLDPDKYLYLRNRAVSACETHLCNQNFDAFEYNELKDKYSTFIGKRVSVDHIGTDVIGTVIDSEFIPSPEIRATLDIPLMPFEQTLTTIASLCKSNKDYFTKVLGFAKSANIVRGSDEKQIVEGVARFIVNSGWVENLWALDKTACEEYRHGLTDGILDGEVTDSSMGCSLGSSVCSVCGNIATGLRPEHEDFCKHIRLNKGKEIDFCGVKVIPFEICRDIEEFFEDSLILPFSYGGKAGGEGADKDAKLLEVFSSKKKVAYVEGNPNPPSAMSNNPSIYVMVGHVPENVQKNKEEFVEEKLDQIQQHIDEQSAPGEYPKGTIINFVYENEDIDGIIIEEYEDETLVVAVEELDDPVEITTDDVNEILEKPSEANYEQRMDMEEKQEMHPEKRAA